MNLPEDVRKDIECPVCLQLPRDIPIFQCDNGHIICKDCKPRLELCPQCRTFVGHTRSLIAERIVSKIKHKCKFADDGCDKEVLFEDLQGHEVGCDFRPIPCVISDCNELIKRSCYLSHMKNNHCPGPQWLRGIHFESARTLEQLRDEKVKIMVTPSHSFFVVTEFLSGILFKYIFILGSQEDRDKYECSVKIGTLNKCFVRTIMEYNGYINVIGNPERVPCVTLHPAQLKHYINATDTDVFYLMLFEVKTVEAKKSDALPEENLASSNNSESSEISNVSDCDESSDSSDSSESSDSSDCSDTSDCSDSSDCSDCSDSSDYCSDISDNEETSDSGNVESFENDVNVITTKDNSSERSNDENQPNSRRIRQRGNRSRLSKFFNKVFLRKRR